MFDFHKLNENGINEVRVFKTAMAAAVIIVLAAGTTGNYLYAAVGIVARNHTNIVDALRI